jgi:hypothetical protein
VRLLGRVLQRALGGAPSASGSAGSAGAA